MKRTEAAILDLLPDLFFRLDHTGRILDCKSGKLTDLAIGRHQLIGKRIQDVPDEAARRILSEAIERVSELKEIQTEYSLNLPEGLKHYELRLLPAPEEQLIAIVRDITTQRQCAEDSRRMRTEQLLRHQDALHELTLVTSDDLGAVFRNIIGVSARTLEVGRASVWLFSNDRAELNEECLFGGGRFQNGEPVSLVVDGCPTYFNALQNCRTIAVTDATSDPSTTELVSTYLSPKGIVSKLDASIRLHGNIVGVICHETVGRRREWTREEEHFVASLADFISLALAADERRNLEGQLRHSQKMEAVGVLAGGVAHDFSNVLTVIMVYADLLLARVRPDLTSVSYVDEIQRAAARAEALTRQLLAFSRKQVLDPKILDLNDVVHQMRNMLQPMIGEDVELVTTLEPDLYQIRADRGQIEQVLMNLAVNARDAMPAGGRLRIGTSNLGPDPSNVRSFDPQEPQFVLLTISDTGIGMEDETLSRIFEPFFTTKKDGKGSGLGLSTVYGIVEQSGGQIDVESLPGAGTTFRIYFPAVHGSVRETPPAPQIEIRRSTNREKILFVEDEDGLRQAAVHALRERGYRVWEVRNGIEALKLCSNLPDHIHLLITDVVMPQLDGHQLAAEITRTRPETKILYVSGYAKGAILDKESLEPNSEFLAKPFRLSELLQKVSEVLGAGTRPLHRLIR